MFFLLISSPRYLYVSTSSRVWPLSLISDFFPFPILGTLHFAAPNSMWYFRATWFVMSSISCSVLRSWCMRQTSSIHRKVFTFSPVSVTITRSCSFNSFNISSMSVAYSMTYSSPPCLILSLILISLVSPCLVWIFAVRLLFSFFTIWRFFPVTPFLWRAYSMASSHALSYAFWTFRNTRYAMFPLFLISFMICLSTMRWSTDALPGIPPAWASVIFTAFFTPSFMILSYTLPTLLARVIPHSFEHLPLVLLPLYRRIMFPWSQLFGIFSFWWILLMVFDNILVVVSLASMNNSFGIPSGPRLFFSFLIF